MRQAVTRRLETAQHQLKYLEQSLAQQHPSNQILQQTQKLDELSIRLEKASAGTYDLEVQDFQGRVISKRSIQTQAGDQNWNFSTDLAAGTYFVLLRSPEGKQYSQRMIIQ